MSLQPFISVTEDDDDNGALAKGGRSVLVKVSHVVTIKPNGVSGIGGSVIHLSTGDTVVTQEEPGEVLALISGEGA